MEKKITSLKIYKHDGPDWFKVGEKAQAGVVEKINIMHFADRGDVPVVRFTNKDELRFVGMPYSIYLV